MYAAVPDLNSYFDAIAVHPYSGGSAPDERRDGWGFTARLDAVRAKFASHGAQDKPLWITEIGWSTCQSNKDCVSEPQQAANLKRMFELVRTTYASSVRAVFVYHRTDLNSGSPTDPYPWYGIQRRDGSAKPAFAVFKAAAGTSA
jgi:exo-beta-1,3-glucanase (GH17 family)